MAFTGVGVDPGLSPTLIVAVEQVGGLDFQGLKLVDSTPGSAAPTGIAANPLNVLDAATQAALALIQATLVGGIPVATGGLTDTQLRAAPVPVTGPLTDTQLRASSVPTRSPGLVATGTINGVGQSVALLPLDDSGTAQLDLQGALTGSLVLEGTVDGISWFQLNGGWQTGVSTGAPSGTAALSSPSNRFVNVSGLNGVRVRCTAFTGGSSTIVIRSSNGTGVVYLGAPLPGGTATLGSIKLVDTGGANVATVDTNGNLNVSLKGGPSTSVVPTDFTATSDTVVYSSSASSKGRTVMNDTDQDCLLGFSQVVTATSYSVRVKAGGGFFYTDFVGSFHAMMVAAPTTGKCLMNQLTG